MRSREKVSTEREKCKRRISSAHKFSFRLKSNNIRHATHGKSMKKKTSRILEAEKIKILKIRVSIEIRKRYLEWEVRKRPRWVGGREYIFFRARDSRNFHFSAVPLKQQPDHFSKGIFYGFHPLSLGDEEKTNARVAKKAKMFKMAAN